MKIRNFSPPPKRLKLSAYIFKYPKQFWFQAAGGIIYNTVIVSGSIFLGKTIDAAGLVYAGKAGISQFYYYLFLFLASTLLFQIARYFKRYYTRIIVNLMGCDIRAGLLDQLMKTPLHCISREKTGDLMSRMVGDVDQVCESVRKTITEMWDTILFMVSYFTACLVYSPGITLLACIPIPFALVLAELLRHPVYSLSLKSRRASSDINIHLRRNVTGISLLRLFGLEEAGSGRFASLLKTQYKWQVLSLILLTGLRPLYIFLANLGVILVIGLGGRQVVRGIWTIGTFTAYLAMFTAMATRTNTAARVMNTWHGAKASWNRIYEKISEAPGTGYKGTAREHDGDKSGLRVEGLSFSYPFSAKDSVENISFSCAQGEIIGITGPVGSGKSALAAALSALYPFRGKAYLNGISLDGLGDKRSGKIAYMDSGHFVFSDDLLFNVTLGRNGHSPEEALDFAELAEDISRFDNGIRTRLMERGVRVSGGQRQRISLARAWYGDSELVIMDDPFSAIDTAMEMRIMERIRNIAHARIVLLFSHRLSVFPLTDQVIVLRNGMICEQGSHAELMERGALYQEMYTAQNFFRKEGHENG